MRKIIFGLGVLLMLVQNGFAFTDEQFDEVIARVTNQAFKQILRCEKAIANHYDTSDPKVCLKAIEMIKKDPTQNKYLAESYTNAGVLYDHSADKLNAYKYFMKAAKLGDLQAQKNLDILCKKSSWVCK